MSESVFIQKPAPQVAGFIGGAQWTFIAATAGDPAAGNFRLNNATQLSATEIAYSKTTDGGLDLGPALVALGIGTTIIIQDTVGTGTRLATITGTPVDNGTWVSLACACTVARASSFNFAARASGWEKDGTALKTKRAPVIQRNFMSFLRSQRRAGALCQKARACCGTRLAW